MKELIQKFRDGDRLTDDELLMLIKFYSQTEYNLRELGTEYMLAWVPVTLSLSTLTSYALSRNIMIHDLPF